MKQYENYIFDLYGTLVDIHTDETRPGLWRDIAALYGRYGARYVPAELRAAYLREVTEREAALGGDFPEIRIEDVFEALYRAKGRPAGGTVIRETAVLFRARSTTHLRLYAGVVELLDALRRAGRGVFLLSNAQRAFTEPELERLGLADRFDDVLLSSDVGRRKPDGLIFRALLDRNALRPEGCLIIGNDPVCDIGGAGRIGIDGYYICSALSPSGAPVPTHAARIRLGMDLRGVRRDLLGEAGT